MTVGRGGGGHGRRKKSGFSVAGATNSVNARQSEAVAVSLFFRPLTPRY